MTLWQTVSVAAALGIDCLGVAAAISATRPTRHIIILTSALFGVFQSGMALAGRSGGTLLAKLTGPRVHLASPIILILIGLVMLGKGIKSGDKAITIYGIGATLAASFAVSLDALGVGIAFGLTHSLAPLAIMIIGIFAFLLSLVGFTAGLLLSRFINFTESAGGILLIVLAIAMLISF